MAAHQHILLTTIIGLLQFVLPGFSISYSEFAVNLLNNVASNRLNENIIISPASIHTCLALAFMGADGKTADQMVAGLYLQTSNKDKIQNEFKKISNNIIESNLIKIANKMYLKKGSKIRKEYDQAAIEAFNSKTEAIDFSNTKAAANTINNWVAQKTNGKIANLLDENSVDSDTSMMLVNAIYFKAEWQDRFQPDLTTPRDFWTYDNKNVKVDMMFNDMYYKWANITELDSTALEVPYKDSEYSMLFILPNQRNGLKDLLAKLKPINLLDLADSVLNPHFCEVYIPKFQIEFGLNLNEPLRKMGMTEMFTSTANFSKILESGPVRISDVEHKAFITINEFGSEATGATFVKIVPLLGHSSSKLFSLDHPFVYAIKDKNQIYFMGQVVKF